MAGAAQNALRLARHAACLALLGATAATAAEQIRIGRPADLAEAGVRFAPFDQIPLAPVAQPRAVTWQDGSTGERREVYRVEELWKFEQTMALFTNDLGRIVVGRVLLPRPVQEPELMDGRFISRQDFTQVRRRTVPAWSGESLRQWVEDFTGEEVTGFSSVGPQHAIRSPCREFHLASTGGMTRAFLLKVEDRGRAHFLLFHFSFPDPDHFENLEAAIFRLLRSVTPSTAGAAPDKAADLLRQRKAPQAWQDRKSPEFAQTKADVIRQIQSLPDWWYVEMPNYILASNLPRRHRLLVDRLQQDIETLRSAFAKLFPPVVELREVSVIRVFADRSAYDDYVGEHSENTLGVWMPSRKELVIAPTGPAEKGQDASDILKTAYHEAFHQYVFYALDRLELPSWLDEGHAELFEASTFDASRSAISVEENEAHVQLLEQAAKADAALDLVRLMYMPRERFYGQDGASGDAGLQRSLHYAGAWAFVYFLRKGVPALYPDQGYDRILPTLVEHLQKHPRDLDGATDAALAAVDRGALQRDFEAFWKGRAARTAAKRYRLFGP